MESFWKVLPILFSKKSEWLCQFISLVIILFFWLTWHHPDWVSVAGSFIWKGNHILYSFDIKTLRKLLPFSIVWISWQINLSLMEKGLKRKWFPLRKVDDWSYKEMKEDIIFPGLKTLVQLFLDIFYPLPPIDWKLN